MTSHQHQLVPRGIFKNIISVEKPPHYNNWIAFDVICVSIVVIVLTLRFVEQRKIEAAAKAGITNTIGNVSITLATVIIVIWTGFSTKQRIQYRKWKGGAKDAPNWTSEAHMLYFFAGFMYIMTLWLIKAAFLSMYFRIVPSHISLNIRRVIYIITFYVGFTFALNFCIHLFWCHPISANWAADNPTSTPIPGTQRHCTALLDIVPIAILFFTNITTDLGLLSIPLLILRSFTLRGSREKYAFIFVYLIGLLSFLSAMFRFFSIIAGFKIATDKGWGTFDDQVVKQSRIYTEKALISQNVDNLLKNWATIEYCSAILAFCLPSLRNLLKVKRDCEGEAQVRGLAEYESEQVLEEGVQHGLYGKIGSAEQLEPFQGGEEEKEGKRE